MAEAADAFADAQREVLKRVGRYKRAPGLPALRHRLGRYCGGEAAVEHVVMSLMKSGRLRCTNKLFHLPITWDDFFSDLG